MLDSRCWAPGEWVVGSERLTARFSPEPQGSFSEALISAQPQHRLSFSAAMTYQKRSLRPGMLDVRAARGRLWL